MMRRALSRAVFTIAFGLVVLPATAHAAPAWSCSAGTGWVAAGATRISAPAPGGTPCPVSRTALAGAAGSAGSVTATGTVALDGGSSSQTTDTRTPKVAVEAQSLAIRNGDGRLVLTASGMSARATGSCDANRRPVVTTDGSPGQVALNGHSVDTSRDYSEPGVGVNGAPLFGTIRIRFGEVTRTNAGISRRAIHLTVADRDGTVVFEAVGGEVALGREGAVCDPPPVCPPGTEPRSGRCVEVTVTPLPQPPSGTPAPPVAGQPLPGLPPLARRTGCADVDARRVAARRLRRATLCLINVERKKRHLRALRLNGELNRAAGRHARDMLRRHYFGHTAPSGRTVADRILRSGYLRRYGRWSVGENLGWGWGAGGSPRQILGAWMKSRPHRRNILDRRFHDVGVAIEFGAPRGSRRGSITYVIDFGGFSKAPDPFSG